MAATFLRFGNCILTYISGKTCEGFSYMAPTPKLEQKKTIQRSMGKTYGTIWKFRLTALLSFNLINLIL